MRNNNNNVHYKTTLLKNPMFCIIRQVTSIRASKQISLPCCLVSIFLKIATEAIAPLKPFIKFQDVQP